MSSRFSSNEVFTNNIDTLGGFASGTQLEIGRLNAGNIVIGTDNTIIMADTLRFYYSEAGGNIDTLGAIPMLIGKEYANGVQISKSTIPVDIYGSVITLDAGAGDGNIFIGQNSVAQEGSIILYEDLYFYRFTDPVTTATSMNLELYNDSTSLNICNTDGDSSTINIGYNGLTTINGTASIGRFLGVNPTYISVVSSVSQNSMRFYSNENFTQYGSSIVATGGTAVANEGTLGITANAINLTGTVEIVGSLNTSGSLTATGANGVRTNVLDRRTSGSLSIGSNALTTAVSIQKQLTLSNPLILGSAPTLSTELGNTTTGTINAFGTSGYTSATLTIVTAGVYMFNFAFQFTGSGSPSFCNSVLSGSGVKSTPYGYSTINTTNVISEGTQIVIATATVYNITSVFGSAVTGVNATNSYFTATRIA
jgi:hypothetical protein